MSYLAAKSVTYKELKASGFAGQATLRQGQAMPRFQVFEDKATEFCFFELCS